MAQRNKSPYPKDRNGVEWWHYDFKYKGKRFRGWIDLASKMPQEEAEIIYKEIWAEKIHAMNTTHQGKIPTQIFKAYLDHLQVMNPRTYDSYQYLLPKVNEFFGQRKWIDQNAILKFRQWMMGQNSRLGKSYAKSSINRHLYFCRNAYNLAKIEPNPFNGYGKLKEEARTRYLTENELQRLFDALAVSQHPHLAIIVLTAIFTGLRKNAVLSLHESGIDLGNMLMRVKEKGDMTKTVAIPAALAQPFEDLLSKHPSGYLFENPATGSRWINIEKPWRKARQEAGLKDFRFHDLRHTFATYTLLATGNVRLVQSLLGHADLKTTEKYTHILAVQKADVVNQVVDAKLGRGAEAILRKSQAKKNTGAVIRRKKVKPVSRAHKSPEPQDTSDLIMF